MASAEPLVELSNIDITLSDEKLFDELREFLKVTYTWSSFLVE